MSMIQQIRQRLELERRAEEATREPDGPSLDELKASKRRRVTQRQRDWFYYYLCLQSGVYGNATGAARRAGYAWPNHCGPKNVERFRVAIDWASARNLTDYPDLLRRFADAL